MNPTKIDAFANCGRFVVGFMHQDATSDQALREQLGCYVEAKSIMSFVTRIDQGKHVGVCLLQGIGSRDQLIEKLEADPRSKIALNETFSPMVLKSRQLREFAELLPDGLPSGAKPPYEPPSANESFAFNATDGYRPPDYKGEFFVAFSHKSMDSPIAVSEFCDEYFAGKSYFDRTVVSTVGKFRSMAFAVVKGPRGIAKCVEDLKQEPGFVPTALCDRFF